MERIEIGDNNLFGPNVVIVDHDHEYKDSKELICKQGMKKKPVKIGSNVWIGANVTILAGVHVGRGATIAAGAVVNKDVPPYSIVGGVPSRVIKFYWTKDQILEHERRLYPENERLSIETIDNLLSF